MTRIIYCIKLNKKAEGLDYPPYSGELGKRIYETISKEAWANWLKYQTILVNENRLMLADIHARQYLIAELKKYFFNDNSNIIKDHHNISNI